MPQRATGLINSPTDIVLILDKSGSMAGVPFESLKEGARTFIDIIEKSTDGQQDGQIGAGSRIGIVGFSSTATIESPLTTSVADLKNSLDLMVAGGATNHQAAFQTAFDMMDLNNGKAKVMVMFTDGKTTEGPPAEPTTAMIRSKGILIYCIALSGTGGIEITTLESWASQPSASYVSIAPDPADLELIFAELAANISRPGATGIVIKELLEDDFELTGTDIPSKGTAEITGKRSLEWKIDKLGTDSNESATLQFGVRHTGKTGGTKFFNKSVNYSDNEGNAVIFPNPTIDVKCDVVTVAEKCPKKRAVTLSSCEDFVTVDAGKVRLQSQGRILQLDLTLTNVCPFKEVVMAVVITEKPDNIKRGMKVFTIPPHTNSKCSDVKVKNVVFILPDDCTDMCRTRKFDVQVLAHYASTDYGCYLDDEEDGQSQLQ